MSFCVNIQKFAVKHNNIVVIVQLGTPACSSESFTEVTRQYYDCEPKQYFRVTDSEQHLSKILQF